MFNPDLKKMLKNVNSRYSLVVGTAKRAREIRDEAILNDEKLDRKTVSIALKKFTTANILSKSLMKLLIKND